MGLVRFRNDEYDYFEGTLHYFSSDGLHSHLFNFVANDEIQKLSDLFEEFISKKMNISTLELTSYEYSDSDFDKIKSILFSLHPYYVHEWKSVFVKAVGNFLNDLIKHFVANNIEVNHAKRVDDEEFYLNRFTGFTKQLLKPFDNRPRDYYRMLTDDIGTIFVYGANNNPLGFGSEIGTLKSIKQMLFWILDIQMPHVGNLSAPQRVWLFSHSPLNELKVIKVLVTEASWQYQYDFNKTPEDLYPGDIRDFKFLLSRLNESNVTQNIHDGIDTDAELIKSVEYAKKVEETGIAEIYEIDSLYELLYLEIMSMAQKRVKVKRCGHCNMYFVVPDKRTAYCNRIAECESEPCHVIGPTRAHQKKVKDNPALNNYYRAYKARHNRVKKGKMTQSDFLAWCDEAKAWLNDVRENKLSLPDFIEQLKRN